MHAELIRRCMVVYYVSQVGPELAAISWPYLEYVVLTTIPTV